MKELIRCALEARKFSYSPYSSFKVGAALMDDKGRIYTGCNIENSAFTPTNCAERTAFFKAISEGSTHFKCIAIVGGANDMPEDYVTPCGVCRQVMREFCDNDFLIITAISEDEYRTFKLSELLPESFGPDSLGK